MERRYPDRQDNRQRQKIPSLSQETQTKVSFQEEAWKIFNTLSSEEDATAAGISEGLKNNLMPARSTVTAPLVTGLLHSLQMRCVMNQDADVKEKHNWEGFCPECRTLWTDIPFEHAIFHILCPRKDCDGIVPVYPEKPDE